MTGGLARFLQSNALRALDLPPLVHSTRSYNLELITQDKCISVTKCDVLKRELNYFFVGRPAYKHKVDPNITPYWEVPTCFIFECDAVSSVHKIFPFDSGAHANGRMPSYVSNIPLANYELPPDKTSAGKLMGALFGSVRDYLQLQDIVTEKSLREDFIFDVLRPEILSLQMLASDRNIANVDDRKLVIEISSTEDVPLNSGNLLAVVCPADYYKNVTFRRMVEEEWKATPIPYGMMPLNYNNYISEIYDKVFTFYESKGLIA